MDPRILNNEDENDKIMIINIYENDNNVIYFCIKIPFPL
jgi:hypothetical protein